MVMFIDTAVVWGRAVDSGVSVQIACLWPAYFRMSIYTFHTFLPIKENQSQYNITAARNITADHCPNISRLYNQKSHTSSSIMTAAAQHPESTASQKQALSPNLNSQTPPTLKRERGISWTRWTRRTMIFSIKHVGYNSIAKALTYIVIPWLTHLQSLCNVSCNHISDKTRSRIPIITPIVIINAHQTAITEMLTSTSWAATSASNVLVCLPQLVTSDSAVITILIRSLNVNLAPKLLVIGPAITRHREWDTVRLVNLTTALHVVDSLVAPFD